MNNYITCVVGSFRALTLLQLQDDSEHSFCAYAALIEATRSAAVLLYLATNMRPALYCTYCAVRLAGLVVSSE
jgi:hypothetical protein